MRRLVLAFLVVCLSAALVSPAAGASGKKRKPPSGIQGTVVNSTCYGPCVYPQPAPPPYTGEGVTVEVRRAADGALVATRQPTDGRFRVKVRRGIYTVTAYLNGAGPTPQADPMIYPPPPSCGQSDSEQVRVFRHRFSAVELQLANVCIL